MKDDSHKWETQCTVGPKGDSILYLQLSNKTVLSHFIYLGLAI